MKLIIKKTFILALIFNKFLKVKKKLKFYNFENNAVSFDMAAIAAFTKSSDCKFDMFHAD